MATIDEELKRMRGASPSAFTPFSQARGAEAIRGFGSGMAPRLSEPQSIFAGSAQQSSQDFSRLQMPQTPSIPLGNTIPAFPDNYNQAMTDRSRAPSAMVSGLRDTTSGFGIYGDAAQLGSGQTPPMAPVTNTISSFGSPLASITERIESPYGIASTTLAPEQQVMRAQARQQAEQAGTMPRTPEQQQALLAQMRQKGADRGREMTQQFETTIAARRANPATAYIAEGGGLTGPSTFRVGVPTNKFGEPVQGFANIYQQRNERMGQVAKGVPTTKASTDSLLAATGFGAMQRAQQASMQQPLGAFGNSVDMSLGVMEKFTREQPTTTTQTSFGKLNLPNVEDFFRRRSRRPTQTTLFT
jgi:hypothetical protein